MFFQECIERLKFQCLGNESFPLRELREIEQSNIFDDNFVNAKNARENAPQRSLTKKHKKKNRTKRC